MAFEMIDLYRLYTCESGDVKKVDDIERGSILKETDTGFEYIFNGVSWVFYPRTVQVSDGTNTVGILEANGCHGLVVVQPAHESTKNSFYGTLASGESFIGEAEDIINFGVVNVMVTSTLDCRDTDGFTIEYSVDGITFVDGDFYELQAGITKLWNFQCPARYYRVKINNASVGTTTISLQVILKVGYTKPSSMRVGDVIVADDDSELVKAVLTAQRTSDNLFVPITASPSNNLRITDAESGLAISKGEVDGTDFTHKFGDAINFDASDGVVHVWDGADNGQPWEQMIYTFPIGENVDSLSSSDNTDTELITLEGLDIDGIEIIQTVALQGHTRVAITPLYRFHRGYSTNGTRFTGHVIISEDDGNALVNGVPVDTTLIKGIIQPQNQQTEMAIYTIPTGFTGYMWSWYANTAGAKKESTYIIKLNTRLKDKVFRLKHRGSISDSGSSYIQHEYKVPKRFPAGTDIEMTVQMTLITGTEGSVSAGFEIVLVAD